MPYPKIDPRKLDVFPLAERPNITRIEEEALDPASAAPAAGPESDRQIKQLAEAIRVARSRGAAVMLTYGAHVVKNCCALLVNWLVENGWLTHLATQGAGVIHDWEFAFLGQSGEWVRDNAPVGRFGSWEETGRWINLAVIAGAAEGLGFGEAMGRLIQDDGLELPPAEELRRRITEDPGHELTAARADLLWTIEQFGLRPGRHTVNHPFRRYSILACACGRRVPLTVHPGIGYDIIVNHPLYHGGAIGRAATTDVRVFTESVDRLDGGIYLSVGSAIMSPQVFEKAFSAANNLRRRKGRPMLSDHRIVIVDIQAGGGWDWSAGEPPKDNPAYYLRYCKSFYRMGGTLEYLQCDNRVFLANLVQRLRT
ncbi:MAG: hypothetical protein HUU20_02085 [Pirellulales bacterium]|nr:hypothetical protein [Pirellulales bacterium]